MGIARRIGYGATASGPDGGRDIPLLSPSAPLACPLSVVYSRAAAYGILLVSRRYISTPSA